MPVAIANLKFKIISTFLANRLDQINNCHNLCLTKAFVKGRNIKNCICLTPETINVLHKKTFRGNLALKIDIAKAFETIDWNFLLKVSKT